MRIERLTEYRKLAAACAKLLHETFPHAVAPDVAKKCVENLLDEKNLLLAASEDGDLVGFVGALKEEYSHAAELHPLIVKAEHRHQGVGRRLVGELESRLAADGFLTVYLGTDDEDFRTSLSESDLFEDTFDKIAANRNKADHPYSFYEKIGYRIVGVIPDANGPAKPDIIMAKRIRQA